MTRRGFRMFEFLLVVCIFGVIVLVGVSRYLELGRETRRLGFELLAHHYTTAVAGVRARWLIQGGSHPSVEFNGVEFEGIHVRLSPEGWPIDAEHPTEKNSEESSEKTNGVEGDQSSARCLRLWRALLQNPMPASLEGGEQRGERRYHITEVDRYVCRYELVTKESGPYYFDYSAKTGQVLIQVPPQEKISDL